MEHIELHSNIILHKFLWHCSFMLKMPNFEDRVFFWNKNHFYVEEWRSGDTDISNMLVQNSAVPGIGDPSGIRIIWFKRHLKTARNQAVQYKSLI